MSNESEQDIEVKRRTMKYLWSLGYFVRRNVGLESPEGNYELTDIDVLGIKIDEELETNFLLCDCKSGKNVRTRERLFWLAGVMKLFGASRGLFIRPKLLSTKYMELAKKVGVTTLSVSQLEVLEKAYGVSSNYVGPFSDEYLEADKLFSLYRKFSQPACEYVLTTYWEDDPPQQITNLIAASKRLKGMNQLDARAKDFLAIYNLALLSLSMLRFSKNSMVVPDEMKNEFIQLELLGGSLAQEERRNLFGGFYDFMTKEISERYKSKYPMSRGQFLDSFIPSYSKYVLDYVARLCKNPKYHTYLPRILDLIAFEQVLGNRSPKLVDMFGESTYVDAEALRKPFTDFLNFVERSELVNKVTKDLLDSKVDTLLAI